MFGQIFGSFYCWLFEDFFGLDLANYLWGLASPYSTTNMFIPIGFTMIGISLAVMLLYYYAINHPKLCSLWGWLAFLAVNAIINFIVGWQWVLSHLYENKMVTVDTQNNEIPLPVDEWNCICFSMSNAILSMVIFIFFTYMFKWWSTNCWVAPENTFRGK